jgi:hypothetical protein
VQVTLRSVTGPDDCRTHNSYARIGSGGTQSIHVGNARGADGDVATFYYGVVSDDMTYAGLLHGGAFSATSVPASYTQVLRDCVVGSTATKIYTFSYTLTGSFSPDRQHVTATEVWTYQTPDYVQTFTFDWIGNAP